MALVDYPIVFWIDSSIYLFKADVSFIHEHITERNVEPGVLMFISTGHSSFSVTHRQLFEYFPSEGSLMLLEQVEASSMVFFRTPVVVRHIVRWLVYCALDVACIAPSKDRDCHFNDRTFIYAFCHRFDQSVVNILLTNYYRHCNVNYHVKQTILQKRNKQLTENSLQLCQ